MAQIPNHQNNIRSNEDGEDGEELEFSKARHVAMSIFFPMVLKAAIDLDLLEIIVKASPPGSGCKLSPTEIASRPPTMNPDAASIVDRILRVLASYSLLTYDLVTSKNEHVQKLYGLAPVAKYFLHNDEGISLISLLAIATNKFLHESWYHLKEATLEAGAMPFVKAHGMHFFELAAKNDELSGKFNNTMSNPTVVPHIKGINFDLPHVIKDAPPLPGVDHVGGDMFVEVPQGDVIFPKWILHDWDDNRCLTLLKNCYNALPDLLPGAKERTEEDYKAMASKAGFTTFKLVFCAYNYWVMELHKNAHEDPS
ncbi:hypothetical protein DITRI_Ditri06bG0125600 [Diplodiscus trichospermus]